METQEVEVSASGDRSEPNPIACRVADLTNRERLSWNLSLLLAAFPPIASLTVFLGFAVGLPVTAWYLPIAWTITCAGTILVHRRRPAPSLKVLVLFTVISGGSLLVSSWHRVWCYDSQVYHYPAANAMVEGWNPVHAFKGYTGGTREAITHFPKGQWYVVAASIPLFGVAETGNFVNVTYLVASLLACYVLMGRALGLKGWWRLLACMAFALNPIAILQSQSGYVDGIIASTFTITVISVLGYLRTGAGWTLWPLVPSVIYMTNVKQTGGVYAVAVLLVGAIAARWITRVGAKRLLGASVLAGAISLLLGTNPYIYNTLYHGNPVYPVSKGHYAYDDRYEQLKLDEDNRPYNFLHTQVLTNGLHWARPKILSHERFDYSILMPVMQNAGFGALFGPLFVVSLVLLVPMVRHRQWFALGVAGFMAGLTMAIPVTIIARYIPQAYLIPVSLCVLAISRFTPHSWPRGLAVFVLSGLVLNGLMVGSVIAYKNISLAKDMNEGFAQAAHDGPKHRHYYIPVSPAWKNVFRYAKLRFEALTGKHLYLLESKKDLPPDARKIVESGFGHADYYRAPSPGSDANKTPSSQPARDDTTDQTLPVSSVR